MAIKNIFKKNDNSDSTKQLKTNNDYMVKPVIRNENGTGVRSYLVNGGLNNSDIGYNPDTNTVTYKGKGLLNPDKVIDGTSYSDENTLRQALINAYKSDNNNLVSATDYASNNTGIDNLVTWRDGNISVGGTLIKPSAVADGKAFVPQNVMDEALNSYKNNSGIKGYNDIYDEWKKQYADSINQAVNAILNREAWSYDPYSDPAYLSYKDAYEREGNRAYKNAYGNVAANTGGYSNSAAMTAAGQQLNSYMQALNDRVPELMQNDYNRYSDEQKLLFDALKSILEVADDDFEKMYQSNADTIKGVSEANNKSLERDIASREWNYEKQKNENQLYRDAIYNMLYGDIQNAKLNEQLYKNAYNRGYYTPYEAEKLGIKKNNYGEYISPDYAQTQYKKDLWENVEKPQNDYKYTIEKLLQDSKIQSQLSADEYILRLKRELGIK